MDEEVVWCASVIGRRISDFNDLETVKLVKAQLNPIFPVLKSIFISVVYCKIDTLLISVSFDHRWWSYRRSSSRAPARSSLPFFGSYRFKSWAHVNRLSLRSLFDTLGTRNLIYFASTIKVSQSTEICIVARPRWTFTLLSRISLDSVPPL